MVFCFIVTLIVVPIGFGYALSQHINIYQKLKFRHRWGSLFENVKLRNKVTAAFWLIFVIRRIVFVSIIFGLEEYPCQSLQLVCYSNLIILIYTGYNYPLIGRPSNRLEMFNELTVCTVSFHMFLFTDWVLDSKGSPDEEAQYQFGILLNAYVLYYLYMNLCVIIYYLLKILFLMFLKYLRWLKFLMCGFGHNIPEMKRFPDRFDFLETYKWNKIVLKE